MEIGWEVMNEDYWEALWSLLRDTAWWCVIVM